MKWLETWLKTQRVMPLRIAGEILFGTEGEYWESRKFSGGVDA